MNNEEHSDIKSIWPVDPEEHGYEQCPHCSGYGSSLKEDAERCTMCGGKGLIKTKEQPCMFCNTVGYHKMSCEVIGRS